MANKAEREMLSLQDSIVDVQVAAYRTSMEISLRAHDRLEHLMADLSEKWRHVEQQWTRMNPSQQAAA